MASDQCRDVRHSDQSPTNLGMFGLSDRSGQIVICLSGQINYTEKGFETVNVHV